MSWSALFFLAGLAFLAAWAYHTVKEYRQHQREETTVMAVFNRDSSQNIANIAVPDVFDESRIKSDLMKLASSPGAIGKYIAQAQIRFTQARQIQVLKRWTEFYNAGEAVIRARTQLARAHGELKQVDIEGEVQLQEKDARIAELEAQIEESRFRASEARMKASDLGKAKSTEPSLTREQERVLKKAEIEKNLSRLRDEKSRALSVMDASDEDARMRTTNMYDDRIAREEEQLSRYL